MTTVRKNLPFPDLFARGRGAVAHADTEWESVMVQITLAFVIILGYLVSKGISDSRDLAQRIAEQEQVNARLAAGCQRLLLSRKPDANGYSGSKPSDSSRSKGCSTGG